MLQCATVSDVTFSPTFSTDLNTALVRERAEAAAERWDQEPVQPTQAPYGSRYTWPCLVTT